MKKIINKYLLFAIVLCAITLSYTVYTYAAGEGIPLSSGMKPLNYVSCTLDDGSEINSGQDISTLQPKFTLQFDKNVVNMLVWEINRKAVSMISEDNKDVLIDVSKIDDTVDFDHRQQIFVQPINPLSPGKIYYIKVESSLIASNQSSTLGGSTDGKGISISFKTKNQQASQDASSADTSKNTSANSSGTSYPEKSSTANDNYSNLWWDIAIVIIITAWIIYELFVKRNRMKERNNKPQV